MLVKRAKNPLTSITAVEEVATTLSKNWLASQRFSQRAAPVGAVCLLRNRHMRNLYDLHNRDIDHLVNTLQQENRYGLLNRRNHWDLPLRHNRDVDNLVNTLQLTCRCTTTGMSTTSKNCAWSTKDSTVGTCLCDTTGMSCTPTMS